MQNEKIPPMAHLEPLNGKHSIIVSTVQKHLGSVRFQVLVSDYPLKAQAPEQSITNIIVRSLEPIDAAKMALVKKDLNHLELESAVDIIDCHYLEDALREKILKAARLIFDSGV